MSSSFRGIKAHYNNAVRRYELLKVATSYENSKIYNSDFEVIYNIITLIKQIETFQEKIKNANNVCENNAFSNTASDLTNLSTIVQKMKEDYTKFWNDINNYSRSIFEEMLNEYNKFITKYESKCKQCENFLDSYENYNKDTVSYVEDNLTDFKSATDDIIVAVDNMEILLSNGLEYQK